jgi:transcriptional regulator with XRE-family HTH domain
MALSADDRRLSDLGRALRQLRRDRGFSQEELARRAGLHPNHLGQIERGAKDLRVTTLLRILDAVEASPSDLELTMLGTAPLGRITPLHSSTPEHTDHLMDRMDEMHRLLLDIRATVRAREHR